MSPIARRSAVAALFAALPLMFAAPSFAQDAIDEWNTIAVNEAVAVAGKPPAAAVIDISIVQIAVYDAVNAIDGGHFQPYASQPVTNGSASIDAAAAQAAHDVLVWLYPAQHAALDVALATTLSPIADGSAKADGIAAGADAASAVIALRTNDGRNAPITYTWGTGPGDWQPTWPAFALPQTPWVAVMKPFTMKSPSQFRPDGPPALSSDEWAEAFNEVKARGALNSSVRTPEETEVANFYNEHGATQFNRYFRRIAAEQGLSQMAKARLFVMGNVAGSDALIGCFDGKYTYGFWRPVTAIPAGGTDGNPDTDADPDWKPLLPTANHPEYPSAHSCFSKGITTALALFFGTDEVTTTIDSTYPGAGPARTYEQFSDLYADVFRARILGGVHYRFSMEDGRALGRNVARQMARNYFQPVDDK